MTPPHLVTSHSVTVLLEGRQYTADTTHPRFTEIRTAVREQAWDGLADLFDRGQAVETYGRGEFEVNEGEIRYKGERLPEVLERRILEFLDNDEPADNLLAFFRRLWDNPSFHSRKQLYRFLEHNNMPIDEEGYFYAYKSIRKDWTDHRTGTVDNSIGGTVPRMERREVDDDPENFCSYGYHVGSLQYGTTFAGAPQVVICKVDPADVVSVPNDCDGQKCRVTYYEVIGAYNGPLPERTWTPTDSVYCDEEDDEDEWL